MGQKHIPNILSSNKKLECTQPNFWREGRGQDPLLKQAERAAVQTVTGRRGGDAEQPGSCADSKTYGNFTTGTPPLKDPPAYLWNKGRNNNHC